MATDAPDRLILDGSGLTPDAVARVARAAVPVAIAPAARARMATAREVVEAHLAAEKPVYGLTTGLGPQVTRRVSGEVLAEYSRLTIRGRANAIGPALPEETVRATMLARLNGLLTAGAGASPAVAESIAACLNAGVHPVIPSVGSVGASDLCLLAHLGLALIGEGEATWRGERRAAGEALALAGLAPLDPGPKDGLAICSASSVSAGQAALVLVDASDLLALADAAAALSMEGFRANLSPLDARVGAARPAPGQQAAARRILDLLEGGELLLPGAARRLQDPLSLRCVAPVHGSALTALDFARPAVDAELNGAADNPLVLADDGEIVSTGNFHAPALALAMETLGQALAHVAALAVSRTSKLLLERLSGLPNVLSPLGPPRAGFAPLMKSADAVLAGIRQLAMPAPMELRSNADGVEDDLTHAFFSARKAAAIVEQARTALAVELLVAAQAVDLAKVAKPGRGTALVHAALREVVPPLEEDRPLGVEVERVDRELLASGRLLARLRDRQA